MPTGFLLGRHKGKRKLGRLMRRWKDNINMDIKNWIVGRELNSSGSGYKQVHMAIHLLVT
jgi:hypothetical protein